MKKIKMTKKIRYIAPEYNHLHVTIVGVGGTGGFVSEHIAGVGKHLAAAGKRLTMTLVDGDIVTESNVGRTTFQPQDVGKNKALVMANRLAGLVDVIAQTDYFKGDIGWPGKQVSPNMIAIIGCVDNPFGRKEIARSVMHPTPVYWIESGNNETGGRAFWGNDKYNNGAGRPQLASVMGLATSLPMPHVRHPEILDISDGDVDPAEAIGCLPNMINGRQSLMVNRLAAAVVGQIFTRLFVSRDIDYWKIDYSLEPFVAQTVFISTDD